MKAVLLLLGVVLLASGCATRPQLQERNLIEILEGRSTRAEIEQLLGRPDDSMTASNRKTLTFYQDRGLRRKGHLFKDEFELNFFSAWFLFQPDGVLEKKLVSETATTSATKLGVRTVGTPIGDEKIWQIVPKQTRYEEAFRILGAPVGEMLTLDGMILREWIFVRQAMFSAARAQVLTAVFDYDTDTLQEFFIQDDVPPDKKRKVK